MAIYFDTTEYPRFLTMPAWGVRLLQDIARSRGQTLALSELAFAEMRQKLHLELAALENEFSSSGTKLRAIAGSSFTVPTLSIDDVVARWAEEMRSTFDIVPVTDGMARQALDRELTGAAPATRSNGKSGRGARDACIWLSCVAHHASLDEESYFVSNDGGFYLPKSRGEGESVEPHPGLLPDIAACSKPLALVRSTKALTHALGKPLDTDTMRALMPDITAAAEAAVSRWATDTQTPPVLEFDRWSRSPDLWRVGSQIVGRGRAELSYQSPSDQKTRAAGGAADVYLRQRDDGMWVADASQVAAA